VTAPGDGESGVMATQLAVLMPALLLLIMLAVQFALWAHATQLADAAADTAAAAAALPTGTVGQGEDAAAALLGQAGNLGDVAITVERGTDRAVATVTGIAPNVVPGFRWSVTGRAAAPLEVFTPESER
jgi:Flp pilus assembly protein TadG